MYTTIQKLLRYIFFFYLPSEIIQYSDLLNISEETLYNFKDVLINRKFKRTAFFQNLIFLVTF